MLLLLLLLLLLLYRFALFSTFSMNLCKNVCYAGFFWAGLFIILLFVLIFIFDSFTYVFCSVWLQLGDFCVVFNFLFQVNIFVFPSFQIHLLTLPYPKTMEK